jgi:hypothetical protein
MHNSLVVMAVDSMLRRAAGQQLENSDGWEIPVVSADA